MVVFRGYWEQHRNSLTESTVHQFSVCTVVSVKVQNNSCILPFLTIMYLRVREWCASVLAPAALFRKNDNLEWRAVLVSWVTLRSVWGIPSKIQLGEFRDEYQKIIDYRRYFGAFR